MPAATPAASPATTRAAGPAATPAAGPPATPAAGPVTTATAVARLRDIVATVADLDPAEVTEDASFYDGLQIDSLHKLEIMVRIEREFGLRLTDVQAAGLDSVGGAVDLLRAAGACGQ